ncbi:MAG: hypothetical protein PHH93_07120, partial [Prolixibacteraceae bacterium]|nr:hypothetical protein [Prolixibacteraceae bacterium]
MSKEKLYFIIIAIVICFLFIYSSRYFYKYEQNDTRSKKHEELHAIARLKANRLTHWHNEMIFQAEFFSKNEPYRTYALRLINGDFEDVEKFRYSLSYILASNRYANVYILDEFGELHFSYESDFDLS